jgi:hypothetical protein
MMKKTSIIAAFIAALTVMGNVPAFCQVILPNDTLYIGNASGTPGQHIMVPVYIRTTEYYQGWTLPFKFGNGTSPLVCDSVSFSGTIMENWAWKSKFVNNNQWDGVQTCGATGIYVWAGDSLLPGYYLALKLFFGIAGGAPQQTIPIDTTTCSFASGGQQNNFIVVVHTQSWRTIVVPGSVTIGIVGNEEADKNPIGARGRICPNIVARGSAVMINTDGIGTAQCAIRIFDAGGRMVDEIHCGAQSWNEHKILYSTGKLASGVHFLVIADEGQISKEKFIIE